MRRLLLKRFVVISAGVLLVAGVGVPAQITSVVHTSAQSPGTVHVLYGDDFEHNRARLDCYVRTQDGRMIPYAGPCSEALAGAAVDVNSGQHQIVSLAQQETAVLGKRSIAVILTNLTDDTSEPFTREQVEHALFNADNPDSVASRYRRNSYGKVELTGKVFGWVAVRPPLDPTGRPYTDCNKAFLALAEAKQLAGVSGYDHYMLIVPKNNYTCPYAGVADIFAPTSWIFNNINTRVIFHELGHNFGLLHASYLLCTTFPSVEACAFYEYGDPSDPMGFGNEHLHAYHKARLGWVPDSDVLVIGRDTVNRTLTLTAVEELAGIRDATIPFNDGSPHSYQVEYRCCDSQLHGVLIRVSRNPRSPGFSYNTLLVSAGYGDPANGLGAALTEPGQIYRDPYRGITITLQAVNQTSAVVEVGGVAFDPNAPGDQIGQV